MRPLRQSTSTLVTVGPLVTTNGAAYSPTNITGTLYLNGVPNFLIATTGTNYADGTFALVLPATNLATAGRLTFAPTNSANYVPRVEHWDVYPAGVYDLLIGTNNASFSNIANADVLTSSRMGTFSLPTNFALASIDGSGRMLLQPAQTFNMTGSITGSMSGNVGGNVIGSVGSVTGAVGSVTGGVTVATNNDKGNYSLSGSQTFNMTGNITGNLSGSVGSVSGSVASVTGNVGGNVTGSVGSVIGAVGSVTGAVGSIAAGGITSSSFSAGAVTAASIAATALNGKGDWLLASGYTTPPTTAAIANAVLDAPQSNHASAGTIGYSIQSGTNTGGAGGGTNVNVTFFGGHAIQMDANNLPSVNVQAVQGHTDTASALTPTSATIASSTGQLNSVAVQFAASYSVPTDIPMMLAFSDNAGGYNRIRTITGVSTDGINGDPLTLTLDSNLPALPNIGDTVFVFPSPLGPVTSGGIAGSGNVAVNHNTPTTDFLRLEVGFGSSPAGLDGADVRAYLATDYYAGNVAAQYIKGQTITGPVSGISGRMPNPMYLASGNTYVIAFAKTGYLPTTTNTVTI